MRPFLCLLSLAVVFNSAASLAAESTVVSEALDQMQQGNYEKAFHQLEQEEPTPQILRLLIELSRRSGKREEAGRYANRLIDAYRAGALNGPAEIAQAAFAAWKQDRWQEANDLYMQAAELPSPPLSLFVDWGHLYLEKYNPAEAESIFRDGLKASAYPDAFGRWKEAAAYLGLARALKEQSKPGSGEALAAAQGLDPENLEVLAYTAQLAVTEEKWDEAVELLDQGLKINSRFLPLLEVQAAYHYFRDEPQEFEQAQARVLEINPNDGDFFELMGDLAVSNRRLREAVQFYREAVRLDPRHWPALASLGINLLRLGDEEEGKAALEQAYANDPFNLWTVNTLRLLDSFVNFERLDTPHFSIKLHREEAATLRPYVEALLEKSLQDLMAKYAHRIEDKVVFEMYPDHEDFAVRTLGLPGLGALGATFGTVVAMDSPSARPKGEFHWGSTLWHEIAHVVTLSLSDHKVPRWLTEGLSMMEERLGGTGWGDGLNTAFVQAYKEDKLLPLADLNSGFIRPRFPGQVQVSYFQAGWLCEFLSRRFGSEKIRGMLVAYAEGQSTEAVFENVLGETVAEVDQEFQAEMAERLEPLTASLVFSKLPDPSDASFQMALGANPDNYALNLNYGRQLFEQNRFEEASPYLLKALELFPSGAGPASPYELLSRIYLKQGNDDAALEILEKWWQQTARFPDTALKAAELLRKKGEAQKAVEYMEAVLYVDPLAERVHELLGELYLEVGEADKAVREFQVLIALDPVDRARAHYLMAQAYKQAEQPAEARRQILYSLEIAPGYEAAQQLLLELVRQ